jgi:hypothetical protein
MRQVSVREATIKDAYRVAADLRPGDAAEVTGLGLEPRAALRTSFRHAIFSRVALVDDEVAAIWGLGGSMLSDEGVPWLMTTPKAASVPVSFLKVGRDQLSDMLAQRSVLRNVVAAHYAQACRFLEILGFILEPAVPLGPNATPFRPFWIER